MTDQALLKQLEGKRSRIASPWLGDEKRKSGKDAASWCPLANINSSGSRRNQIKGKRVSSENAWAGQLSPGQ